MKANAPAVVSRGLGRYGGPVYRLGRLAVTRPVQDRGLGGGLLLAAGRRCLAVWAQVGGVALLIDAKSDNAATWYETLGAIRLDDAPLTLLLPLNTIAAALQGPCGASASLHARSAMQRLQTSADRSISRLHPWEGWAAVPQ